VTPPSSPETVETEKVTAKDGIQPEPDEQLLSRLTSSGPAAGRDERESDTKSVESRPAAEPEEEDKQIKKNVLDQLMGKSPSQTQDEQTDKPQTGESGDE
jgi:hypothetical protein